MEELKKTCVVGITSHSPYDTSIFADNNELSYKTITYHELKKLYKMIKTNELEPEPESNSNPNPYPNSKPDPDSDLELDPVPDLELDPDPELEFEPIFTPELKFGSKSSSSNINLIYIHECIKSTDIKLIFRFLCSSDCADGELFVNEEITDIVFKFVKLISERECLIEFSDHSLGSFFTNWKNEQMGMEKPIEILKFTHSGEFRMRGKKTDFENSSHPTLKQIGDMASDKNIEITFNNMNGTKVYKVLNPDIINVLSTGNQLNVRTKLDNSKLDNSKLDNSKLDNSKLDNSKLDNSKSDDIFNFKNNDYNINEEKYLTVPVHSVFDYNKAKIILSATHWCNLDTVETPIDMPKLKRYYTESMGYAATQELENELSKTTDINEQRRLISTCVRDISSGTRTINFSKYSKK